MLIAKLHCFDFRILCVRKTLQKADFDNSLKMPQEFQVLRCVSCSKFQGHQLKKAKKWLCKVCGQKQSFMKVYGQGTGKECRIHVQKLNALAGKMEEEAIENVNSMIRGTRNG
jgi:heme oxygenase